MIISKIYGGLGNQMFQYAVGRALSQKLGVEYLLDVSDFEVNVHHQGYELSRIFNIEAKVANSSDVQLLLGCEPPHFLYKVIKKIPFLNFRKNLICEPSFSYWSGIKNVADNSYLDGYWQSERYFNEIENLIRNDFSWKLEMTDRNLDIQQQIISTNSISLHIRRGDYLSSAKANKTHGTCSIDYYNEAIKFISDKVENPHFYIFSDDMDWVKENFKIRYAHSHISHNSGLESYNDMRLMSFCKHNILANSTFSWWAGWLNSNKNKIVIAPQRWFNKDICTDDLIPIAWNLM